MTRLFIRSSANYNFAVAAKDGCERYDGNKNGYTGFDYQQAQDFLTGATRKRIEEWGWFTDQSVYGIQNTYMVTPIPIDPNLMDRLDRLKNIGFDKLLNSAQCELDKIPRDMGLRNEEREAAETLYNGLKQEATNFLDGKGCVQDDMVTFGKGIVGLVNTARLTLKYDWDTLLGRILSSILTLGQNNALFSNRVGLINKLDALDKTLLPSTAPVEAVAVSGTQPSAPPLADAVLLDGFKQLQEKSKNEDVTPGLKR